jgi:hypothetical protein
VEGIFFVFATKLVRHKLSDDFKDSYGMTKLGENSD